jgi:hypothetical protein
LSRPIIESTFLSSGVAATLLPLIKSPSGDVGGAACASPGASAGLTARQLDGLRAIVRVAATSACVAAPHVTRAHALRLLSVLLPSVRTSPGGAAAALPTHCVPG